MHRLQNKKGEFQKIYPTPVFYDVREKKKKLIMYRWVMSLFERLVVVKMRARTPYDTDEKDIDQINQMIKS